MSVAAATLARMTHAPSPTPFADSPIRSWNGAGLCAAFLGSGSSGNCTVVRGPAGAVVVDNGFSARETLRRFALAGGCAEEIVAILVSHEHSDHVSGIGVLARKLRVPVYASAGTCGRAGLERETVDVHRLRAGDSLSLAGLRVTPFRASHDAVEPVGFRFDADGRGGGSLGLLTDTGVVTTEAFECLDGVCALALESNHDEQMLIRGPYPQFLKRRILSERGHLSNDAAAAALDMLLSDRLEAVFAMHISRTNNEPDRARTGLEAALQRLGAEVPVRTVPQGCLAG